MVKYIIRNCPANYPVLGKNECLCGDTECQDCTDCIMKQIVDLCKKEGYGYIAREILHNILDIQEVE